MLSVATPYIEKQIHPTKIVKAYFNAMDDALKFLSEKVAKPIDPKDVSIMSHLIKSCVGTKFTKAHADKMVQLALEAVTTITRDVGGKKEVDIKRYARVEKVKEEIFEIIIFRFLVDHGKIAEY